MTATVRSLRETPLDFGDLLREWRQHRRMSQLDLSLNSGISQRHISFLETGRARPSRPMVIGLADALGIPLRERNALLECGGFRAAYSAGSLDDQAIALFREALQLAIEHHEPYPAVVLDGRWNLVMINQGALRFFSHFLDPFAALEAIGSPHTFQMVRLCLRDEGFKPYIRNWTELVYSFLQRARQGLLHNPGDLALRELIEEILTHPDTPARWQAPDWKTPPSPAINMVLDDGHNSWSLFTMLAHFGSPQNVTIEELSVELFYPADPATRARLIALAANTPESNPTAA
jgi:transcriptional regulator with XRE-family HTH domain